MEFTTPERNFIRRVTLAAIHRSYRTTAIADADTLWMCVDEDSTMDDALRDASLIGRDGLDTIVETVVNETYERYAVAIGRTIDAVANELEAAARV